MLLLLVFRRGLCALRLVVVVVGLHAFPRPMIESEINIGCPSPPIVDDPLRLRSKNFGQKFAANRTESHATQHADARKRF